MTMAQDGHIRSHWMTHNMLITRLCLVVSLLSYAFFNLFAQDPYDLPPVEPKDITFIGKAGRILTVEEVQERMLAFNEASGKLLTDLGSQADPQRLKVISFNAGMLSIIPNVVDVPKYAERAKLLVPALKKADFDILCLQEVFYGPDIWRLKKFARDNGYYFYRGRWGLARNRHGMAILIRKSLSDEPPTFQEHRFHTIAWHERLFGYRKGVLSATLKLNNGRTVGLTTTHLTAYIRQEHIRAAQIDHMMEVIDHLGADYTIVTGDLNSTMEPYPNGDGPKKMTVAQQLVSKFHLVDSYTVTNPGKNEPTVTLVENPTAEFGISTNLDKRAEERIDFIMARARKNPHTVVTQGKRIFTEDVPVISKPPWWAFWYWNLRGKAHYKNCKLSDHFGVFSEVTLF